MSVDPADAMLAGFAAGLGRTQGAATRFTSPLQLMLTLDRRMRSTQPLRLIDDKLVWADSTPDARLIVVMPPQEGKSELISHYGPIWSLMRNPDKRIALASYSDVLAKRWGRKCRNDIRDFSGRGRYDLGLRIAPDLAGAGDWQIAGRDGGMVSAGISSGLTGRPVDDLRIDDPLKNRDEAESVTVRETCWNFWEGTAVPRLAPGAPVIVVMTRWHHDDLVGRLMDNYPGEWEVLHIPAQADPVIVDPDPLGRKPGEYMESARLRTESDWDKRKEEMGDQWEALGQGNPSSPGGDIFNPDLIRRWHRASRPGEVVLGQQVWRLADCWVYVTVDLAYSKSQQADWTCASAWAIPPDGSLVLLDARRRRVPAEQQIEVARPLVERFKAKPVFIESNMRGTTMLRMAIRDGWSTDDLIADADKIRRSAPAARFVRNGRVWFPAEGESGSDLGWAEKEVKEFPNSRHDDFVDTLSYAAIVLLDRWSFTQLPPRPGPARVDRNDLAARAGLVASGPAVGFDPDKAAF